MMQHLKIALENKVKVIVITRPLGDFKDKNTSALQGALDVLKVAGVSLVFKSNITKNMPSLTNESYGMGVSIF